MAATLKVIIDVDDKGRVKIRGVGEDVDKLSLKASSLGKAMHAAAAGFGSFAKIAGGAAVAGVAAFGASVVATVKQFATFEDKMLQVKGIMGASAEEYKALTALTRELGMTTRYTATEAAEGLLFLAMAGLKTEQAIGALPPTLMLAQASVTGLGETADILTNIMSQYQIEVKDLVKTSDVLTATFTNSNTNLSELGQAFKYAGPVAKAFQLEIEETAAILAVLAQSGYKAEMGGTALRNIITALVAPMGNAGKTMKELGVDTTELGVDLASSAAALKSLGVNVLDVDKNLRPIPDIMDDLKEALEGVGSKTQQGAVLMEIFGKRGGPQLLAMMGMGGGAVREMEEKIRSLGGVTNKIGAEMESGMGGALRGLVSAIEAVGISYGGVFAPAVKIATESVTAFARELSKNIENGAMDQVGKDAEEMAKKVSAAFGEIVRRVPETMSALMPLFKAIADGFYFVGDNAAKGAAKVAEAFDKMQAAAKSEASAMTAWRDERMKTWDSWVDQFVAGAKKVSGAMDELNGLAYSSDGPSKATQAIIDNFSAAVGKIKEWAGVADTASQSTGELAKKMEELATPTQVANDQASKAIETIRLFEGTVKDASWMYLEETEKIAAKPMEIKAVADVDGTSQPVVRAMRDARASLYALRDAAKDKKVTFKFENPDGRPTSAVIEEMLGGFQSMREAIRDPFVLKIDNDPAIGAMRQTMQMTQGWLDESRSYYDKFWMGYFGDMERIQRQKLTSMVAQARMEIDHEVAMMHKSLSQSLTDYNAWLSSDDPVAVKMRKGGHKPFDVEKYDVGTGPGGLPKDGLFYGHQGEIVLNPQESREYRTNNNNITINVSGAGSPEMTAAAIKRQLDNLSVRWGTA